MRRLLVNDYLTTIPGTKTFWHDLQDWFGMEFFGGEYSTLVEKLKGTVLLNTSIIIRNASWFPPIVQDVPTISLLQDIFEDGPQRKMQEEVIESSTATVCNSKFTASKYEGIWGEPPIVIPLPVDFSIFEPGNPMGLQQALSLPDGCVCWIGACREAAGMVKGWDIFLSIVRRNPDIPFVGVFKDQPPDYGPPNLRMFTRVNHEELVKIIGACRVGLCTSRMESQHLAGIEMGACGLPMVAPKVGVYWEREDIPGCTVDGSVETFEAGIRRMLASPTDPNETREYWRKEFDREIVRKQWESLITEVECSGAY